MEFIQNVDVISLCPTYLQVYSECGEQWNDTSRQAYSILFLIVTYILPVIILVYTYQRITHVMSQSVEESDPHDTHHVSLRSNNRINRLKSKKRVRFTLLCLCM